MRLHFQRYLLYSRIMALANDYNCLPACDSSIYESSVSYTSIPADYTRQFYCEIFGDDLIIDRNIVGLSLYFVTFNVKTETTSFSYSLTALLSDIGGQLGFFLGISVIHFLELCTWLLDDGINRLCCWKVSWRGSKGVRLDQRREKTMVMEGLEKASTHRSCCCKEPWRRSVN